MIGIVPKWTFTMSFKRGDVVLVLFPNSNLRTAKRRPALVVQANHLRSDLPQTIVALISSNMSRAGHPSRVVVSLNTPEGQRSGLKTESVILTDNLATILDNEIDRVIGSYGAMDSIDTALRHTLGL